MTAQTIVIPYKPRPYQAQVHVVLDATRFSVIVMHRRAGKTVMVLNQMIKRALLSTKPSALFAYIAPFREQAKSIAWRYLQHFSMPIPGRKVNQADLSITLTNGAVMRLFGADNPDALRGLRFDGVVLDEVADMKPFVWEEVVRPALSDRRGWAIFIGTPKGQNLFFELFQKASHEQKEWAAVRMRVDETGAISEEELAALKEELSENVFRQEYLCDFSASRDDVLIPIDLVTQAAARVYKPADVYGIPVVLGVDVARSGADSTVFCYRQGLVCEPLEVFSGLDTMAVADRLAARLSKRDEIKHCCIDVGMGAGVIDRLKAMGFHHVLEVPFAGAANDNRFLNRRAEMWWSVRDWLKAGGALPNDPDLKNELAAPLFSFNTNGKVQLEKKDQIKKRLGKSPDRADALALTFAVPVRYLKPDDINNFRAVTVGRTFRLTKHLRPRWR